MGRWWSVGTPTNPTGVPAATVAVDAERPRWWRIYTCCRCAAHFTRPPRLARLLPKAGLRSRAEKAERDLAEARAERAEADLDSTRQALTRVTRPARSLAVADPTLGDVIAAAVLGVDPRDCLPGAALTLLEGTYA